MPSELQNNWKNTQNAGVYQTEHLKHGNISVSSAISHSFMHFGHFQHLRWTSQNVIRY